MGKSDGGYMKQAKLYNIYTFSGREFNLHFPGDFSQDICLEYILHARDTNFKVLYFSVLHFQRPSSLLELSSLLTGE